jgi:hypothetical protein
VAIGPRFSNVVLQVNRGGALWIVRDGLLQHSIHCQCGSANSSCGLLADAVCSLGLCPCNTHVEECCVPCGRRCIGKTGLLLYACLSNCQAVG